MSSKPDPRLVLRKKLDALDDKALCRRYAKVMGRSFGSVSVEMDRDPIGTRERFVDVLVYAATRQS